MKRSFMKSMVFSVLLITAHYSAFSKLSALSGSPEILVKIIKTETGWGYDVYVNGKMKVHQPHIPVVTGLNGFKSRRDAKAVGKLVKQKIRKGLIPPSVSRKELDSLKVVLK
ncbi:protein of unknown function [Pseudarcicella hirudinis]|uniref:DUF4907 domain-containing protein n=1 Tax=Pseudarcicella hirudinis TaxID=1079859 RepID=A0A1I5SIQ0_9BACT|nr:DUF4907 domain-containing protein [Pseudarcicella hirudinis]SFP70589.1 protein of unknown function [Pseudarcicella hirudinis]